MDENKRELTPEEIMKNAAPYPDRAADAETDLPPAEGVYAGPVMPVAMMTYAGPQMMNNGEGFQNMFPVQLPMDMFRQETQEKPESSEETVGGKCEMCGYNNPEGSRFCSECGYPLTGSDDVGTGDRQ